MRHYEIILAGSVPFFLDLERMPSETMDRFPKKLVLQLMLLLLVALVVLMPLLWLVSTSLKGPAENIFSSPPALVPAEPSLNAYVRLFQDNPLSTYLFNSTIVSALAVVANLLFCSLAAYPLARMRFAGRGLVQIGRAHV